MSKKRKEETKKKKKKKRRDRQTHRKKSQFNTAVVFTDEKHDQVPAWGKGFIAGMSLNLRVIISPKATLPLYSQG